MRIGKVQLGCLPASTKLRTVCQGPECRIRPDSSPSSKSNCNTCSMTSSSLSFILDGTLPIDSDRCHMVIDWRCVARSFTSCTRWSGLRRHPAWSRYRRSCHVRPSRWCLQCCDRNECGGNHILQIRFKRIVHSWVDYLKSNLDTPAREFPHYQYTKLRDHSHIMSGQN